MIREVKHAANHVADLTNFAVGGGLLVALSCAVALEGVRMRLGAEVGVGSAVCEGPANPNEAIAENLRFIIPKEGREVSKN